jgi:hypothetical protein
MRAALQQATPPCARTSFGHAACGRHESASSGHGTNNDRSDPRPARVSTVMIALNNYINGREVRSTARTTTTIVDPVTGNAYATAPKSNAADLDAAFRAATDAFKTWKETTPAERQLLLLKIADALMEHKDELAAAECKNCGKPRQLTIDEELQQGADQIRFFAGAVRLTPIEHAAPTTLASRPPPEARCLPPSRSAACWRASLQAAT